MPSMAIHLSLLELHQQHDYVELLKLHILQQVSLDVMYQRHLEIVLVVVVVQMELQLQLEVVVVLVHFVDNKFVVEHNYN